VTNHPYPTASQDALLFLQGVCLRYGPNDPRILRKTHNKESNGGAEARYRAAYTGQSLRGIAEINRKEQRLYMIGGWELKKK
jgi:hypothetical protein